MLPSIQRTRSTTRLAPSARARPATRCDRRVHGDTAGPIGSPLRAASQQKDLKVNYSVKATVNATPSAQATEQPRRFLSDPVSLTASGGLSQNAVTLAGDVGFTGKSYHAEA